jgi:oligopeptide transport system ATP-binding protein
VLLRVENLKKYFPVRHGLFSKHGDYVYAVDGVSLELRKGEILGIVGESGSGKTTLGKAVLRLIEPTDGTILFEGKDVRSASQVELNLLRRQMQMIFQDPYASLNPRMTNGAIIGEGLFVHGFAKGHELEETVTYLLEKVGLAADISKRYPHELSGGQRQRVGIARAISMKPRLVVGDEPLSALDVSIQAQVINLLLDLQAELDLSYILIAHDLSVVEHMCDRVAIMYLGKIVEMADRDTFYELPLHPYSQSLLGAVPVPDPDIPRNRVLLKGDIPSPIHPPPGCRFHTRCPEKKDICQEQEPVLRNKGKATWVACHLR